MKDCIKNMILSSIGGILYIITENIWRGYSHWTMFFVGGLCFLLIGTINEILPWDMPLWKQAGIGAVIITSIEFITGCIVNLWLEWNVWDYSGQPGNLMGQICILYTLIWFVVSLAAIVADDWLRYWIFKEERPRYKYI